MKRIKSGIISPVFALAILFGLAGNASAQIKTDQFFPDTTKGFFAVTDIPTLRAQWSKTKMGQVVTSPAFDSFRETFANELETSWMKRFGMSFRDVIAIAAGEIGGGLVASPGGTPGYALVVDVTGKEAEVKDFLTKLIRKATSALNGESRRERIQTAGGTLDVTVMVIPPDQDYPKPRTIYYTQIGNFLIAADQKPLIQLLTSQEGKPLAELPAYQATIGRCSADYPAGTIPQVRLFISPLEFGEAIHSLSLAETTGSRKASPWSVLAKQGFDGIQGIGGTLDFASGNYEAVLRIKVFVPEPPTLSLKMLAFSDSTSITIPDWVDESVNRASFIRLDFLTLFTNLGPLFDDFLETPGVWDETLQSLEKDERGPKVNLKTDLIAHLDSQISILRTFRGTDEKYVAGVAIREGKSPIIAEVFHRMFDSDPDFRKIPYENDVLWAYSPQPKGEGRPSSRSTRRPRPSQRPVTPAADEPILGKTVFFIGPDALFVSNDADFLNETLKKRTAGTIKPMEGLAEYQAIKKMIDKDCDNQGRFFQGFSDNKEGMRVNYQLLREGKLLEAKTLVGRVTQAILRGPERQDETPLKFDASTLPPFEDIADQFGPSGGFARTEKDGWFYKGFRVAPERVK